ncbi:hypothetical protein EOA27_32545 [Mesorhizobium sp. M2A.F.Ca.ET.037.01.1.1]|uniref:hypothetical protein n=1 Tax=unclassified Mesorhizobium TaxID=325217 RepID=UPI000F756839|nr:MULTISPECIES: hypothetical protein [unclassified Mesorhizobium]RVC67424.1 hypothetical protein EN759_15370 [Mesorhizobium sp. M00.F.Ca.ET.038.03.1.1]AZO38696.1 hypothetical protein EJ072_32750 [Mesorhizobium sp. M2A.F.Ca.ET.046.03.2.1]RUX02102.1 hypothetical protein EOA27_32545 [Mesorhizobium sp. M2A.F.Ca.ET.037.01.1.1]RWA80403.1 MAG: hypothetical protein EOQ31_32645 [Mesorhizobium sp.]RWB37365.1 MAG: hypothetical protein EOQ44_33490 [Mesorhizobium sp.]
MRWHIKAIAVALAVVLVARFALFDDAAEFRNFAALLMRYGPMTVAIWALGTVLALIAISLTAKPKQARAVSLLTRVNYVLVVVLLGGSIAAFKLGFLA